MTLTGKKLDPRHLKYLRGLAHDIKPVLSVGHSGITPAVIQEATQAIEHHELIKVKLPAIERKIRRELLSQLANDIDAEIVQVIGRNGILFRRAADSKVQLPTLPAGKLPSG